MSRHPVLYLSYNPSGSPLVRSQVLPYLRGLSDVGDFHLLAFEGATPDPPPLGDELDGVSLHTLRYHKRPTVPAKLLDVVAGIIFALWLVARHRIVLLHARSHVPALIATVVGRLARRRVIFDMRGFLADEYVEAETWRRGAIIERVARIVERLLLRAADAVVVLTDRAQEALASDPATRAVISRKPLVVVPCCVDLNLFQPREPDDTPTLVYAGSVGTWYLLENMVSFFRELRSLRPDVFFLVLNRGQHADIHRVLRRSDLPAGAVQVLSADFSKVPDILGRCAAGIVLLREGRSKIASSPIKLAEYLASGLPVVINDAVGDAPRLVAKWRAGVILRALDREAMREAAKALDALLREGRAARERARALAESHYGLALGVSRYRDLYSILLRSS